MENPQNEAEQGTYLDLAVHAVLAYAIYRRARSAPEMAHPFPLTRTLTQRATGNTRPVRQGEAPGVAHHGARPNLSGSLECLSASLVARPTSTRQPSLQAMATGGLVRASSCCVTSSGCAEREPMSSSWTFGCPVQTSSPGLPPPAPRSPRRHVVSTITRVPPNAGSAVMAAVPPGFGTGQVIGGMRERAERPGRRPRPPLCRGQGFPRDTAHRGSGLAGSPGHG
jgi:hypothetical protein